MTANNSVQLADGVTGALHTPSNGVPVDFRQYLGVGLSLANPLPVSQAVAGAAIADVNPNITEDVARALLINAKIFTATTGFVSTVTNGNLFGGIQIYTGATGIAKNLYIFNAWVFGVAANASTDAHIRVNTATDAALAVASTVTNLNLGSGVPPLVTVTQIVADGGTFSAGSATPGTKISQGGDAGSNGWNFIQNSVGIYIPANTQKNVAVYFKIVTAGNSNSATIMWGEF